MEDRRKTEILKTIRVVARDCDERLEDGPTVRRPTESYHEYEYRCRLFKRTTEKFRDWLYELHKEVENDNFSFFDNPWVDDV